MSPLHREGGVGDVDDAQSVGAIGHVGEVARHRDAPRVVQRAELHWERGVGDIDDEQSGPGIGDVDEVAHHLDVARRARRIDGTHRDERTGSRAQDEGETGEQKGKQSGEPAHGRTSHVARSHEV